MVGSQTVTDELKRIYKEVIVARQRNCLKLAGGTEENCENLSARSILDPGSSRIELYCYTDMFDLSVSYR
jgi:hypothetical protein